MSKETLQLNKLGIIIYNFKQTRIVSQVQGIICLIVQ